MASPLNTLAAKLGSVLRWGSLGLLGLCTLLVGAVLVLTQTAWGRGQVLSLAQAAANDALPGTINVGELSAISPYNVVLKDVTIETPAGEEVLRARTVAAGLGSVLALTRNHVDVDHVRVEQLWVDLADLSESRGLLAAVVPPPDSAPTPPSDGKPWTVFVRDALIDNAAARMTLSATGPMAVDDLHARGAFRMDKVLTATLDSLAADLQARALIGQDQTLSVSTLEGRWVSEGSDSHASLIARYADAEVAADLKARSPTDEAFEETPLQGSVRVTRLDGRVFRALGMSAPLAEMQGPVSLDADVHGRLRELKATARVDSPAGQLSARATRARDAYDVRLQTEAFSLARLLPSLPEANVGLSAQLQADMAQTPRFSLRIDDATLDGNPLPSVVGEAELDGDRLQDASLEAHGYGGDLNLEGQLDMKTMAGRVDLSVHLPDLRKLPAAATDAMPSNARTRGGSLGGSLRGTWDEERLDVNGDLSLQGLRTTAVSARDLQITLRAKGKVSEPEVDLRLRGWDVHAADQTLNRIELYVTGGPTRYRLRSKLAMPHLQLSARATTTRIGKGLSVDAQLNGRAYGHAVSAHVEAPYVGFDGRLGSAGSCPEDYGRSLQAPGKGHALHVSTRGLDLSLLPALAEQQLGLTGTADLDAYACGGAEDIRAYVDASLHDMTLIGRPALQGRATVSLSADQGVAVTEAWLRSGEALDASVSATAEFPTTRNRALLSRLRDAKIDGRFVLRPLSTEFVERFLGTPLPVKGQAQGEVKLDGSLQEHSLTLSLDGSVAAAAQAQGQPPASSTDLHVDAHYRRDEARIELTARDQAGQFLTLTGKVEAPGPSLLLALDPATQLAQRGAYSLDMQLEPRVLAALPLAVDVPPGLSGVRYAATLNAQHAPDAEPDITLNVHATLPESPTQDQDKAGSILQGYACSAHGSELDLNVELQKGALRARASALRSGVRTLSAAAQADLPLKKTLMGQQAPELSKDAFEVLLMDTAFDDIPLLCAYARGQVQGKVTGKRLLGSGTSALRVELHGKDVRLAGSRGLEIDVQAALRGNDATAKVRLQQGDHASTVNAKLPLQRDGGKLELDFDEPVEIHAQLHQLPLGPLLPLDGPVSQARGSITGNVDIEGTLRKPKLQGELAPQDVSLTITPLAQPLRKVTGRLAFTEDFLRIDNLRAYDGDGSLTVNGEARLRLDDANDALVATELKLKADGFPLRSQGQPVGELDAEVDVKGGISAVRTGLQVMINDASVWLAGGDPRTGISLAPHPDIHDPRTKVTPVEVAADETPHHVRLRLSTRNPIWVQRDDFAVRLSADLDAEVDPEGVTVSGELDFKRGYLQLLGATFDLESNSRVSFVGTRPPDPALAIKATAENRRSGSEVTVNINGRASSPELTFAVDGLETSAGDAALALFGGQGSQTQTDATATDQARTFVAGVVASVMAISARREFGDMVPILMVEPQTAAQSTRIRAGFELDRLVPPFLDGFIRGVYLEGIFTGSGGESSGVQGGVHLELYLPSDFVAEGQYGPGETFSLDLGYQP